MSNREFGPDDPRTADAAQDPAEELLRQRRQIDRIDREITRLFEERMEATNRVGAYKIRSGRKVYDREREQAKLAAVKELAHGDFNQKAVSELFTQIMNISRKKQFAMLEESGVRGRTPFIEVDALDRKDIRVVFQGVEGSYSHAAMQAYFGNDIRYFHVQRFREAMEVIAEGSADYAVLPIENSTAGIVTDNFDLLVDFENYIVAEQIIPVEHVLMAYPGTKISDIRRVYSHPQALSQCEGLFDRHREWLPEAFGNTALAARKIAQDAAHDQAAIGSAFAAGLFGLDILEKHVNDQEENATRFMIVTNQRVFVRGSKKISICFELPHSSGTLYNILSNFIFNDVNMTHIESRPIQGRSWEYRFFIDFDGNLNDAAVRNALRGIREEAINMKILGNY